MSKDDFDWLRFTLRTIQKDIEEIKNDAKLLRSETQETKILANVLRVKMGVAASIFGVIGGVVVKLLGG